MNETGKNNVNKYSLCQNYDKKNDTCSIKNFSKCSKNDFEKCSKCLDYLVKENLVMF